MFALWDWPHVRCRVFDHNISAGTHMFVHKCSLCYQLMKAPPDICVGTIKASIVSIPAMELAQTSPLVKVRPFSVWSEDRSGKDRPTMTSNIPRISLQSSPHFGHRKGMKDLKWNLRGEKVSPSGAQNCPMHTPSLPSHHDPIDQKYVNRKLTRLQLMM